MENEIVNTVKENSGANTGLIMLIGTGVAAVAVTIAALAKKAWDASKNSEEDVDDAETDEAETE